jgi:hypothetical protein
MSLQEFLASYVTIDSLTVEDIVGLKEKDKVAPKIQRFREIRARPEPPAAEKPMNGPDRLGSDAALDTICHRLY